MRPEKSAHMLILTSLRIPPELHDAIAELAARRSMSASALMRDILEEYIGHKPVGLDGIQDHVRFDITVNLKTLYLTRFLADSIDGDKTRQVLTEAEDFIKRNGLDVRRNHGDHG